MIANAKDSIIKDEKGFFGAPFDLERSGKIKGECLNKFLTAEQADGIKFLYNIETREYKRETDHKTPATARSSNVIMD